MLAKIAKFIRTPKPADATKKNELELLLERANYFFERRNVAALEDLQRLILRPIQSTHMADAYLKQDHGAVSAFHTWNSMGIGFIPGLQKNFIEFALEHEMDKKILPLAKLGRDNLLPTSWHPSSIVDSIGQIGEGRKYGSWTKDSNHKLTFMYPLNIYWVDGGNHSITVGIILAEGYILPSVGYNLSALYPHVFFDGERWVDTKTGEKIGKPRYKELGYVFEIGRLIASLGA